MTKSRVTIKPIEGEALLSRKFDNESEATDFMNAVMRDESYSSLIYSTPYTSLIVILEQMFNDTWVEARREMMYRENSIS